MSALFSIWMERRSRLVSGQQVSERLVLDSSGLVVRKVG